MNNKNKQDPEKQTIKVLYDRTPTFSVLHADGAVSGTTARGKVYLDFFIEKFSEAAESTIELNISDSIGKESPIPLDKTTLIREKVAGFVLQPDSAMSIGKLLIEKAENIMKKLSEPIDMKDES